MTAPEMKVTHDKVCYVKIDGYTFYLDTSTDDGIIVSYWVSGEFGQTADITLPKISDLPTVSSPITKAPNQPTLYISPDDIESWDAFEEGECSPNCAGCYGGDG